MKKKSLYILLGVVLLLAAGFCGWRVLGSVYAPKAVLSEEMAPVDTATPPPTSVPEAKPEVTEEPVATPEPEEEPYISPIDFEALRAVNPDICAWIEIDNTNISYPVVQHPTDNEYYLTHNSDGNYSANGAIFSEDYNTTDFTDPVTVLYGHHMSSGAMFGNLQQDFSNASFFAENEIIKIYTDEALLEYGVFAAVPYSSDHLLYNYDFSNESVFASFFQGVFNVRSLDAQFREEYAPEPGDRVLVLSTCLAGNNTRRFLVMATLLS